jgi:hypothetical protein
MWKLGIHENEKGTIKDVEGEKGERVGREERGNGGTRSRHIMYMHGNVIMKFFALYNDCVLIIKFPLTN